MARRWAALALLGVLLVPPAHALAGDGGFGDDGDVGLVAAAGHRAFRLRVLPGRLIVTLWADQFEDAGLSAMASHAFLGVDLHPHLGVGLALAADERGRWVESVNPRTGLPESVWVTASSATTAEPAAFVRAHTGRRVWLDASAIVARSGIITEVAVLVGRDPALRVGWIAWPQRDWYSGIMVGLGRYF